MHPRLESRRVCLGDRQPRDVRYVWIPKTFNPYFDKLDRTDRVTGPRRLYRRPFTNVETRLKEREKEREGGKEKEELQNKL